MNSYPIADKRHNELYLYTDMKHDHIAWAKDCQEFRVYFKLAKNGFCIRVAHEWQGIPQGYQKGERVGDGLANEPITRIPTMKDFINALKP